MGAFEMVDQAVNGTQVREGNDSRNVALADAASVQLPVPEMGFLRRFRVRVFANTLAAVLLVEVRVNLMTVIQIVVPAGGTGVFSPVGDPSVPVVAGNLISFRMDAMGDPLPANLARLTGSVEFTNV